MKKFLIISSVLIPFAASAALAQVTTRMTTFLEKSVAEGTGGSKIVLQTPSQVFPGDRVVYVLSYHNAGAASATNFAVTDAIPSHVSFEESPDATALVSVDGGKSWGHLATLKVSSPNGERAARPEDVTHIRWSLSAPIPAGADGKLSFRGTVK